MKLARLILGSLALRAALFEASTKDPMRAQENTLLKYLARNKSTEYGRRCRFSSIRSVADFRSRVPLCSYEDMRPYVDRMKKGANNVLTSDRVIFFGITSGTTGTPKFIPVTRYSCDRKNDLMNLWAYYAAKDHPKVFDGKILGIISPEVKGRTEAGIPYGPEDGHAYNNLPDIVKRFYALPYELFYIDDYDARYYSILRLSMAQDISVLATLNPSTFTLLCRRIPEFQERIIADIEKGTLDSSLGIAPRIRRAIERTLKPDRKKAAELKAILRSKRELLPKYFWPNLEIIQCWKGGTVKLYLKELPRFFGGVTVRDFGCLSTEARSSVAVSDKGAGGVLAVTTNFYEFIPKEDIGRRRSRTLLADQLEKGGEYLIIVTTPGGLYRYDIDDIVKVNGFFNRTPVIEFVQKGHNSVSLTGEKIYESHIVETIRRASAAAKVTVRSFCAFAEKCGGTPRYALLTEFASPASAKEKKRFLRAVDKELRAENSEYDDIRKQQLLGHPVLRVVEEGEFEKYRRKRVAAGAHDTQVKLPKLTRDPAVAGNFRVAEEISI